MLEVASSGVECLDDEARPSIAEFARSCLGSDGGYVDRNGISDLYYTMFGIQLYLTLKIAPPARSTKQYIESFTPEDTEDLVHLAALARCRSLLDIRGEMDKMILDKIESFRSHDGGYSHVAADASSGTVYGAYLASLAYRALHSCFPPLSERMTDSVAGLMMPDGSFSNDLEAPSGGTSSTAAAAVLLYSAGMPECRCATEVLISRELPYGGFSHSAGTTSADLLSTATALYALKVICGKEPRHLQAHIGFLQSLWNENGGFSGHLLDHESDCEYSFYAILALGAIKKKL